MSQRDNERRREILRAKVECYQTHHEALKKAIEAFKFSEALPHLKAMERDLKLMRAVIRDVAADQVLSGDDDGEKAP